MVSATTTRELIDVLGELAEVLERIDPQAAANPTPCTDFDVAKLRQHVVGWLTAFTDGFEAADGACSDAASVVVQGDGADQVRSLTSRLRAVLPGAAERPLLIGGSGMPGEMALSMMLWEYVVHGWDLAVATGQAWSPDADAVEDTLRFVPGMLSAATQGAGKMFGPAVHVPVGASSLDRLLGLSGRDPRWRR